MSRSSPSPTATSATSVPLLHLGLSSVGYSDPKRWAVVYPHYLNSARSVSEGRRVPARFAVERPNVQDVVEACQVIQLPFAVELDKAYCRDAHGSSGRGRVRVQLYAADHSPLVSDVSNKRQLLCRIGEIAPSLKMRALRVEVEKKREEKELRELQQLLGGQAAASVSSSSSSSAVAAAAASSTSSSGAGSPSGASTPTASEAGSAKKNNNKGKKKKK